MLILGLSITEDLLTTLVYLCSTCGNTAAHQLVRRRRRLSLFFIPLFTVGTTYVDRCTTCGRAMEVSREQAEAAARQTGPELR